MLPDATVPGSLAGLLMALRSCFTAPTLAAFSAMTSHCLPTELM
jgi:hypothetical protein